MGGGDCSEPRQHPCSSAWAKEPDPVSKKYKVLEKQFTMRVRGVRTNRLASILKVKGPFSGLGPPEMTD